MDIPPRDAEILRNTFFAIASVIDSTDHIANPRGTVHDLGRRHAGYGVRADMYDTVGACVIAELESTLGADFTPDTAAAWASVFNVVADTMLDGAAGAEALAAPPPAKPAPAPKPQPEPKKPMPLAHSHADIAPAAQPASAGS